MTIKEITSEWIDHALSLWNNTCTSHEMLYKPLDKEAFIHKFVHSIEPSIKIKTYIDTKQDILRGFVSGVVVEDKKKAYVSTILVHPHYRRNKVATQLLQSFENVIKEEHPSVETIDIVFFNPIQLEWFIPETPYHDHPNAPGVDMDSPAYLFFLNQKYIQFAKQNVYYKLIQNYTFHQDVIEKVNILSNHMMNITFYNKEKHRGLNELFDDLNNTYWKDAIHDAISRDEPVLIAEKEGLVIGFTGPLKVQPSRRGYFAGIGVHTQYRHHGLGKVLFSNLCYELSLLGADFMTLFTGETNPARLIYEKEGFQIVKSWSNMRKEIHS